MCVSRREKSVSLSNLKTEWNLSDHRLVHRDCGCFPFLKGTANSFFTSLLINSPNCLLNLHLSPACSRTMTGDCAFEAISLKR